MEPESKFERALKLVELGDYASAQKCFRELVHEADEVSAKSTYLLGELLALVRMGQTAEARHLLENSRPLLNQTEEGEVRADLIGVQLDSMEDKWDRVLPSLNKLLQGHFEILRDPQMRDVYEEVQFRRAMRMATLNNQEQAFPILIEALNFDSSLLSAEFYFELARCYLQQNERESAASYLRKALDLGLDDVRATSGHWNFAVLLMRRGEYGAGLKELRIAERLAEANRLPRRDIYKALSVCLYELGNSAEGHRYFELAANS